MAEHFTLDWNADQLLRILAALRGPTPPPGDPCGVNSRLSRIELKLDTALTRINRLQSTLQRLVDIPTHIAIQFAGKDIGMASQVQEGLLIGASDHEFNAEGQEVAISNPAALTYAVDDPTIAKVLTNADDPTIPVGMAKIQGLAVGTCNVTSTDTSQNPPLTSDPVALVVTQDAAPVKLVVQLQAS